MDIGNLLWLFFIVMALQPLIARRWVQTVRTAKLSAIQKARNSRVIAIIHRQESMRFFGFPIARYIDLDDAEKVLYAIRTTPADQKLDIILPPRRPCGAALRRARAEGAAAQSHCLRAALCHVGRHAARLAAERSSQPLHARSVGSANQRVPAPRSSKWPQKNRSLKSTIRR
jgi:hypothetical protein